jgi:hypothetical protein
MPTATLHKQQNTVLYAFFLVIHWRLYIQWHLKYTRRRITQKKAYVQHSANGESLESKTKHKTATYLYTDVFESSLFKVPCFKSVATGSTT